jgi:hypothetical protein
MSMGLSTPMKFQERMERLCSRFLGKPFQTMWKNWWFYTVALLFIEGTLLSSVWTDATHDRPWKAELWLAPISAWGLTFVIAVPAHIPKKVAQSLPVADREFQLALLRETSEVVRHENEMRNRWLGTLLVVHVAAFGLLGWLVKNDLDTDAIGHKAAGLGFIAMAGTCFVAATSMVDLAWKSGKLSAYLIEVSKDGPVAGFYVRLRRPMPWQFVFAMLPAALGLLGLFWLDLAISNFQRV